MLTYDEFVNEKFGFGDSDLSWARSKVSIFDFKEMKPKDLEQFAGSDSVKKYKEIKAWDAYDSVNTIPYYIVYMLDKNNEYILRLDTDDDTLFHRTYKDKSKFLADLNTLLGKK